MLNTAIFCFRFWASSKFTEFWYLPRKQIWSQDPDFPKFASSLFNRSFTKLKFSECTIAVNLITTSDNSMYLSGVDDDDCFGQHLLEKLKQQPTKYCSNFFQVLRACSLNLELQNRKYFKIVYEKLKKASISKWTAKSYFLRWQPCCQSFYGAVLFSIKN